MSYIPYKPSTRPWSNIQNQVYGKRFYPLQEGSGNTIKVVSPAQGSVQRAKSDLKRQMSQPIGHNAPTKRRKRSPTPTKKKRKKKASPKSKNQTKKSTSYKKKPNSKKK